MTNQQRKDWPIAFGAIADLRKHHGLYVKFLIVTDSLDRYWSLAALAADFQIEDCLTIRLSGPMSDEKLSYFYSACDLTILPSTEGFGYPIAESLACGTPVIHGSYGGGAELISNNLWIVAPESMKIETRHNSFRPVFDAADWSDRIRIMMGLMPSREECVSMVSHLCWSKLWESAWKKWLLEGIKTA